MSKFNQKKNPLLFATIGDYKKFARQQPRIVKSIATNYVDLVKIAKHNNIEINVNYISQKFHEKSSECISNALINKRNEDKISIIQNSLADGFYYLCYFKIECIIMVYQGDFGGILSHNRVIFGLAVNDTVFSPTIESGDEPKNLSNLFSLFLNALWYKQHAGIKIKKVPGKARTKLFNCAYKNECKLPVDILDTNWYTTIIRVKPFLRREHYRNVRYGKGRKKSKLVWIPSTLVNGYTRTARKEKRVREGGGHANP